MTSTASNPGSGRVVIVGTGQAGSDTAAALRMAGYPGEISMIGEERSLPYSRPPLSKAYLLGEIGSEDLLIRRAASYEQQRIEVRTSTHVDAIDSARTEVVLADRERIRYDKLVLATGGTPRPLTGFDGMRARNVHTLRTLEDADRLRTHLVSGARAAIVGGGYIGLEFAAVARSKGVQVTVLEAAERVLGRVTAPAMSEFFEQVHRAEGVEIIVNAQVADFDTSDSGDVTAIRLLDGTRIATDFVLVGVGLAPRIELATHAGLAVDDGIVVDPAMRTSDPDIYAVGDVARHPDPTRGGMRRLESVPNALEQARIVAAHISGTRRRYEAPPWFWSDQYDLKLQVVGLSGGHDRAIVRRGSSDSRAITVFYLRRNVLIAADVVNRPADFAAARKLVSVGAVVDPDLLADSTVPVRSLVQSASAFPGLRPPA
ncbi:NAD(P)/FAD-dependent oxidoreductase [Nocardia sp. NPDC052278]|uniref:NAD(P)/FAD-dependent oxidoreductase n=1 Tax=unclassified Nocardia TaxID=2637762 RepID=UPI00369ED570